jgi:hypothetical protein
VLLDFATLIPYCTRHLFIEYLPDVQWYLYTPRVAAHSLDAAVGVLTPEDADDLRQAIERTEVSLGPLVIQQSEVEVASQSDGEKLASIARQGGIDVIVTSVESIYFADLESGDPRTEIHTPDEFLLTLTGDLLPVRGDLLASRFDAVHSALSLQADDYGYDAQDLLNELEAEGLHNFAAHMRATMF